ncbi:MAG: hypothetical protein ACRC8A_18315 [Microcoleaceae cyanobacterium]
MDFGWESPSQTRKLISEQFQVQQLTYDFYQEVQHREVLENYCQWYAETAKRHQQELEKMRGDFNIFGYFLGGDRS